ncbi:hypothetical protein FQN60_001515 [Etheostoma spectabile]|uniref:Uncharacterized protein n=1 Tax=Etheostoma spectabile TaxID=54343 RepID=A0A5J5D9Q2_9PERO|nr:hypothetical protein FQN60_001515 [Etheostoma spectabile]
MSTTEAMQRSPPQEVKSTCDEKQDLGWMQALQQTKWVLWWASQMERSQGLPTSQLAGSHSHGPSSQAGRGTCPDWGCKMEVLEEGSHVVAEAMALPESLITLVATASFFCFFCLCVRYRREVLWRKLLSKIMARTEKPLFRIAYTLYTRTRLGYMFYKRQMRKARENFPAGHSTAQAMEFNGIKNNSHPYVDIQAIW